MALVELRQTLRVWHVFDSTLTLIAPVWLALATDGRMAQVSDSQE